MKRRIEITIKGLRRGGKTLTANLIARMLKELGNEVQLNDAVITDLQYHPEDWSSFEENPDGCDPMHFTINIDPSEITLPVVRTTGELIEHLKAFPLDTTLTDPTLANGIRVIPQTTRQGSPREILLSGDRATHEASKGNSTVGHASVSVYDEHSHRMIDRIT